MSVRQINGILSKHSQCWEHDTNSLLVFRIKDGNLKNTYLVVSINIHVHVVYISRRGQDFLKEVKIGCWRREQHKGCDIIHRN